MTELPEYFWDELLLFVEEGRVVPILGRDLLVINASGRTFQRFLAERLREELRIRPEDLPEAYTLDDVVAAHPPFIERRQTLYARIKSLCDRNPAPVPEPLRWLARIPGFRLFVSTSFDLLTERALNEERYGGAPQTHLLSYSPNDVQDLPPEPSPGTTLFQLFGRLSASPDYAVTDADILEFMHQLQSPERRPTRLFQVLRQSHLLLLGNCFPDWLARFFVRLTKNDRVWLPRDKMEVVADRPLRHDRRFAWFIDHFSRETSLFPGDPVEFVRTLAREWEARHPPIAGSAPVIPAASSPAPPIGPTRMELPPGAVFLSYASEDRAAAERLHADLTAANLDVWYDRRELQSGDEYDSLIQQHIRLCSQFIPLISQHTAGGGARYFRKEWAWALRRQPEFTGLSHQFIRPVLIDDTPLDAARVPEEFRQLTCIRAPGGIVPPEFIAQTRALVREFRKAERLSR